MDQTLRVRLSGLVESKRRFRRAKDRYCIGMSRTEDAGEDALASQRDFYRRLLDLGGQEELEPLLENALQLIVEVTGARVGYLELYDDASQPRFWKAHQVSAAALAEIRTQISRGIIARALIDGRTVETASALADERFADLGSVRQNSIQAVLCAPVGTSPAIGVIYLQGRRTFSPVDRERAELFARQLAPLADRLVRRDQSDRVDHTREARTRLRSPEIIGRSLALARLLHSAAAVAPLDVDVLITGPSGTGKSMLARTLWNNSPRAQGPFVDLNCAAMPEALIENELFGSERGAHSTATRKQIGKVAAAEGGTLFLDEIGELSAGAQAKLLQLLETREYHPLGSTKMIRADVRIVSATNADLQERVEQKRFRSDLYYRLHVVPIEVPGLEDRREDIPQLVEHFCAEACERHKLPSLPVARRTLVACREASWPGHTRQLAHAIEAAVIRASGEKATTLQTRHVFPKHVGEDQPLTFADARRAFERRHLYDALDRHDWSVTNAAKELDLARTHLHKLINDYDLRREGETSPGGFGPGNGAE